MCVPHVTTTPHSCSSWGEYMDKNGCCPPPLCDQVRIKNAIKKLAEELHEIEVRIACSCALMLHKARLLQEWQLQPSHPCVAYDHQNLTARRAHSALCSLCRSNALRLFCTQNSQHTNISQFVLHCLM